MKQGAPLFFLLFLLAGCGKEPVPAARVERPALTLVAGTVANGLSHSYSGEIRAHHETQPGFRIGGKIAERLVDAGARVVAGQALMRLDPGDAGLQLDAAKAQHRLAEADAKRFRALRSKGFVSQAALDAKEAALASAAAQLGLAENQADYTTLRADRAGVVAEILAEAGQVVAAGQPALRLAADGEREVAIAIPESQLAQFKTGAAAEIILLDGAPLAGRLRELSPAADPASRTYAARVTLTETRPDIALGMTARVRFTAENKDEGLLIPLSAVFQQGRQAAVWIVAADRSVSLRPVQIAAYRDDGAIVAKGLAAGERIVSNGVHRLAPGEKIRIIESGGAR
jgi:RND family efflux transporter MFP subunit